MGFVTSKDIQKAMGLKAWGRLGQLFAWGLMRASKLDGLNQVYDELKHLPPKEFIDNSLSLFRVRYEIHPQDVKRIPTEGPFITISNHPLGGLDGILLIKLLTDLRPDYKIIANFLLHQIEALQGFVFPVNPFEEHQDKKSSVGGVIEALRHLKEGHPLGMFPSGEVSTYQKDLGSVADRPWSENAIKLIKRAGVPVVPIYFHARNSSRFYRLASYSNSLRTMMLPREMFGQKKRIIKIRIGNPIGVKEQDEIESLQDFGTFIRNKTYMLAHAYKESANKSILDKIPSFSRMRKDSEELNNIQKVIEPVSKTLIAEEIKKLSDKKDAILITSSHYQVFWAKAKDIPNILTEIGRLREITFRAVGEGTNLEIDLDDYDTYYRHMFLWDNQTQQIVGAYRMGMGKEIYNKSGINGFYLNELFRFEEESHSLFPKTIEMGRAFIVQAYQKKPMPLFLLWKGIVHLTLKYPEYKYLMGGVSISNNFSDFSKSVMIAFMTSHYYDPFLAQYVHPRNTYKVKLKDADKDFILDTSKADLNKFDKLIDEIEPGPLRFPVLLKKYIKQNAKIIAFNVDPKFNDAIDGLMYIKIDDLPESTVRPIMEEIQKQLDASSEED